MLSGIKEKFRFKKREDVKENPVVSYDYAEGADLPARYPEESRPIGVHPPEAILATQQNLITLIKKEAGGAASLVMDLLNQFTAFCQLAPASEYHHHSGVGGLMRHTLEATYYALKAHNAASKDLRVSAKDREAATNARRLAVAVNVCLHDGGKLVTDMSVFGFGPSGQVVWNPLSETMYEWAERNELKKYLIDFNKDRENGEHEEVAIMLVHMIVPKEVLSYIHGNSSTLLRNLTRCIAYPRSQANTSEEKIIRDCCKKGDVESVKNDTLGKRQLKTEESRRIRRDALIIKAIRTLAKQSTYIDNSSKSCFYTVKNPKRIQEYSEYAEDRKKETFSAGMLCFIGHDQLENEIKKTNDKELLNHWEDIAYDFNVLTAIPGFDGVEHKGGDLSITVTGSKISTRVHCLSINEGEFAAELDDYDPRPIDEVKLISGGVNILTEEGNTQDKESQDKEQDEKIQPITEESSENEPAGEVALDSSEEDPVSEAEQDKGAGTREPEATPEPKVKVDMETGEVLDGDNEVSPDDFMSDEEIILAELQEEGLLDDGDDEKIGLPESDGGFSTDGDPFCGDDPFSGPSESTSVEKIDVPSDFTLDEEPEDDVDDHSAESCEDDDNSMSPGDFLEKLKKKGFCTVSELKDALGSEATSFRRKWEKGGLIKIQGSNIIYDEDDDQ